MYLTGFIQILLFGWKVNPVCSELPPQLKGTAQLSSLSALFGDFVQHLQLDKISGVKGKEVTTG